MRHDPEAKHPEARDEADDRDEHQPDDRHARRELAVDDVVAMDRLGQQPRQRALGALAVDRIEGEGQTEQRGDDADECIDTQDRDVLRAEREQGQEDGGRAARLGRHGPDLIGREIERDRGGQSEHDQQHDEPDAQQVIAQLLGGDHAPAGAWQRVADDLGGRAGRAHAAVLTTAAR